MHLCIPRLHLEMLIHKTNLVQVIHLMEGFGKAIFKSSCSAKWPLNTQEKLSGGTLTHLPPLFYAGKNQHRKARAEYCSCPCLLHRFAKY